MELNGKKILFFAPAFFGYELKILDKMKSMGATVDFYDERSIRKASEKALLKVSSKIFARKTSKYYSQILSENKDKEYDYIFFIKCEMAPISILKKLKDTYKDAKLILYLYDSIENVKGIEDKFQYFDKIMSFDRQDCLKNSKMHFRPLFFCDEYRKKDKEDNVYQYDINFIGTIHSDRYKIIKKVKEFCSTNNIKSYWYLFLQSEFMYWYYKFTKKEFRGEDKQNFAFTKIESKVIADVVDKTKVILDIQAPNQTGLTMRTIEILGMKKKLITTNEEIREYDFYNSNNIMVISRDNFEINKDFINKSYVEIEKDIYEKYSLKSWILEVLG